MTDPLRVPFFLNVNLVSEFGQSKVKFAVMLLRLYLFGYPRLEKDAQEIILNRRRPLALLAYLASTQQMHSRETLTTLFWPDHDLAGGRANLRRDLSRLRQIIGDEALRADRSQVGLSPDFDCWVDVLAFEEALRLAQKEDPLGHWQAAAGLYGGDFLAGFDLPDCPHFDEWLFFQREHYRQRMGDGLRQLMSGLAAAGDYERGIEYGRLHLSLDPLHEPTHRELMKLYAWSDQQAAALRQYDVCMRLLDEELGIEPERETTALFEAIRERQFESREQENKSAGEQRVLHHLPVPLTGFVGREVELAQVRAVLADVAKRLVTVVGAGGMGKTRLALALGTAVQAEFAHGVHFVPLAPVVEPDYIVAAIADVLQVRLTSDEPHKQLMAYLQDKQLLLLLDNYEHLLTSRAGRMGEGARLVTEILQAAPQVKVLVTSRERLNLLGESVLLLGGLDVGETAVASSGAAQLLQQQLQMVQPQLYLQADDTEHIHHICQLAQGMPLALVLAASWANMLSLSEIAAEIQNSLDFLATDMADVPERQRSVRAIFEASWRQLTDKQRQIFMKLTMFQGGFRREAAQTVAGASLADLRLLVNKALVMSEANGRYTIHELLRQYAAEQLTKDSDQLLETQTAHAAYYINFLDSREPDIWGGRQLEAIREIREDLDNIRVAWLRALAQADAEALCRGGGTLGIYYQYTGGYQEGMTLFSQAYDVLLAQEQTEIVSLGLLRILIYLSWYDLRFGRLESAERRLEQCQVIYAQLGISPLPVLLSDPKAILSFVALIRGDYETAVQLAQQVRQTAEAQSHPINQQFAYHLLSEAHLGLGAYETARELAQQAYAAAQQTGDRWFMAYILNNMGQVAAALGELAIAKTHFQTSYEIRQTREDPEGMALALSNLGHLALKAGNLPEAAVHFEQSERLYEEIRDKGGLTAAKRGLGMVALAEVHYEAAQEYFREALHLATAIDYGPLIMALLVNLAVLLWEMGERERPLTLLTFVNQQTAADHDTRYQATQLLAAYMSAASPQLEAQAIFDFDVLTNKVLQDLFP